MTPADPLDAVRAEGRRLLAEATEGPWHQVAAAAWSGTNKDPDLVADCPLYADAIAIVWLRNHADALLADPAPEGLSEERPEDYEPRIYGEGVANPGWPYTLNAVGPARVVFDVLHPDRDGGWGFALKQADEQAVAIAEALADAGYIDRLSATETGEGGDDG